MAFTHSSRNGMNRVSHEDYERLEFLGDSVIGLVDGGALLCPPPGDGAGGALDAQSPIHPDRQRSHYALTMHFDEYIRVGTSFLIPIKEATHVLEDVFESFIGALYLDQGREYTYQFVRKIFEKDIESAEVLEDGNPKSNLQEAMQAEKKEAVSYKTIAEEGPAHAEATPAASISKGPNSGAAAARASSWPKSRPPKAALHALSLGPMIRSSRVLKRLLPRSKATMKTIGT
jgi:ribonuclease-3